jgi:cis-3-alkyl-4-acyloxetan-2-one decarboxylase
VAVSEDAAVVEPPPPLPDWIARRYSLERRLIEVDGHLLHVATRGTGPAVVMLHGNPTWGFLWRRVLDRLGDLPVQVVLPDLLGLGLSAKPRDAASHTLARHAALIGRLLDLLGIDRLVFVGQDWGGPIGLLALADRRQRLAGLVVLNTVLGPPRPGFRPTAFHRFARLPLISWLAFRVAGFPQRGLSFAQADRGSLRGEVARAYRWPLRRFRDRVAPLALARMVPDGPGHPSLPGLQRVAETVAAADVPSEVVWGDGDPGAGPRPREGRAGPAAGAGDPHSGRSLPAGGGAGADRRGGDEGGAGEPAPLSRHASLVGRSGRADAGPRDLRDGVARAVIRERAARPGSPRHDQRSAALRLAVNCWMTGFITLSNMRES